MNKTIKKALTITSLVSTLTASALAPMAALADECTTTYGQYGSTTCPPGDFTVDKKVKNPITGSYVDNLVAGDATYSKGSEVLYTLKVTNTGNKVLANVKVTDTVDDYLNHPELVGTYNDVSNVQKTDKTLSFTIAGLNVGESKEFTVKARVNEWFPGTKTLYCGDDDGLLNKVVVEHEGKSAQDTSVICVQTEVLGAKTLPEAGPSDYLPLLPFVGMGLTGIGLFFKRK